MSFKFNPFSGRVASATPQTAYMPQGLQAEVKEGAAFQFDSAKTKAAAADAQYRAPSMPAAKGDARGMMPTETGYQRIVQLQKEWLSTENLMVWQKRGVRDRGSVLLTIGLCFASVAAVGSTIWSMSFPRPPPE